MKQHEIFTTTIKDQVYQILRKQIAEGVLAPGTKLVEQSIADQLNVSRSPVREAIKQLTGDGFVVNLPNKGAFVKKLTLKELLDMYDVRLMFEVYSAQRAPQFIKKSDIVQLKKMREQIVAVHSGGGMSRYLELDRELHNRLVNLSGNEVVISSYNNLYAIMNNFRSLSLASQQRFQDSIQEHTEIIDALVSSDTERAVKYITLHLNLAKDTVQKFAGSQMTDFDYTDD